MRDFGPEFHCAGRCAMYLLWLESRIKDFLCIKDAQIHKAVSMGYAIVSFIALFLLPLLF